MTSDAASDRFAADHPYRDAGVGVVTQHHKTATLAQALGGPGGMRLRTVEIDTDVLGTFTGDIKRVAGPVDTAIAKARLGIEATGHHRALASEGSFGPHPVVGIVTHHREVVVLLDAHTGLTVVGHAEGLAPWTRSKIVSTADNPTHGRSDDLAQLVRDLDPPRHRLIARPEDAAGRHLDRGITKGISNGHDLRAAVARAATWSTTGRVRVETDLRAHMSQLRHPLILQAATDLAKRLAHRCTRCGSPGFGRVETLRGAPCRWCRSPTDSILAHIDGCPACEHRVRRSADGSDAADPGTCAACNP
ncbi:MAG: hypothetical protein LH477_09805 [Nocardioides sp.]|nr:hypothetical protein [Nocardioides sp.]